MQTATLRLALPVLEAATRPRTMVRSPFESKAEDPEWRERHDRIRPEDRERLFVSADARHRLFGQAARTQAPEWGAGRRFCPIFHAHCRIIERRLSGKESGCVAVSEITMPNAVVSAIGQADVRRLFARRDASRDPGGDGVSEGNKMILIAILLPWLALLLRGHIFQAILCLLLQITLLGWIPAAIWAVVVVNNDAQERRHREMMAAIARQSGANR